MWQLFYFFLSGEKAAAWPLQGLAGVLLLLALTACRSSSALPPNPDHSASRATGLPAPTFVQPPVLQPAPGDTLRYGQLMPAAGHIHALLVFARFDGDDAPMPLWEEHPDPASPEAVPAWMHHFISPTLEEARTQNRYENLTLYFDQASLGRLAFTGTAAYVGVPDSLYGRSYAEVNRHVLQNLLGNGRSQPGRLTQPFAAFERWRTPSPGLHLHEADGAFDYVIIVYRRPDRRAHPFGARWNGIAALGSGQIEVGGGYRVNAGWAAGSGQTLTFTGTEQAVGYLIHEIGHHLLGAAHPYIGAGGTHPAYWGLFHTYLANQSINAWERETLGWGRMQRIPASQPDTATDPVRDSGTEPKSAAAPAPQSATTTETLPPEEVPRSFTEITLADYYTTGHAAAFERPDGSLIIFENRQKLHQLSGGPRTHDLATTNPNDRGLFIYEILPPYSSRIHNIRTFPASGHHVWELTGTSMACGSARPQPVFRRVAEHPQGVSYRDNFHIETEDSVLAANNPYPLYHYENHDPERCITHTRGMHFETAFGPASESGKTLFTAFTNPAALDRNGRYAGISAWIPAAPDSSGKLRVIFSEDPFFTGLPEPPEIAQHLFFTESTRIPENASLRLTGEARLYISPGTELQIDGELILPDGTRLTGPWSAARLTSEHHPWVKPLPPLPKTVTRAPYGSHGPR